MTNANPELIFATLASLWDIAADDPRRRLLPLDQVSLTEFHQRLREFIAAAPRELKGSIDPAAIVRGKIVAMGEGSVIEAGAVIHHSCRLVLGARSVVRAGAVLRDEVVVGADCMVGVHCEVVRSVVLGPRSYLGHFVYMGDSIAGRDVNVAGNVMMANTLAEKDKTVELRYCGARVDSLRASVGAFIGDGVRFGASNTLSPGCIVLPDLALPPHVALYGTIDTARRRALMAEFARAWGGK